MSKAFIQKISLPFNPLSVSGCVMWFDAFDASYTTSGNTVTGWTNKSGNSSATGTTGVLINQTTLMGKSSLRISSGTLSIGPITYSTYFRNFFVVANFVNTQQLIVGDGNSQVGGAPTTGYYSDIELNYPGRNGIVAANPSGNFGVPCILSLSSSTGNVGIWVTGNSQTITTNNLTPTFFATGTASSQQIGSAVGSDFYEVMVYDGLMTSAQRQQFEGYLAQKWGLTANLPPGHPGLTQTIYTSGYNAKNPGIATTPSRAMTNLPYINLFSPTSSSIGACQLWLDGTDTAGTGTAPANGTTVSTWVDKSGNGRNAVAVVAGTYSSAQKSITFSGTNYYNSSYTAAPTSETLFIVFNMTTNNNPFLIASSTCGGRVADPTELLVFTGGAVCYTNGAATTAVVTLGSNTLGIVVTDGTNNYVSLHGALMLSGPVSVSYTGGTTTEIGGALGAQYLTNGYINEVIAYNSVLGTTQRQLVEGYLAWKWGLTSSLPSTHPFKSVPPGRPSQVAGIPLQVKMSAIRVVQLQYSGTYTTAGNFFATFTGNGSVTVLSPVTVNYFAIGGGGGGGGGPGGGGGAGGLQMGSMSLSEGTYNIVIGPGGPAHTNGSNTTFGTTLVVALGGGFGANGWPSTETAGSGGCGGGQGGGSSTRGLGSQGFNGAIGIGVGGTGGGGVGGIGTADIVNTGGTGGIGVLYYGTYYGGGGGGGPNHGAGTGFAGAGGLGGGGRGGQNGLPILEPVAGTPNTGGGGGGGRTANQFVGSGAAGGSGVFIISY
jgi:hypothetical protein